MSAIHWPMLCSPLLELAHLWEIAIHPTYQRLLEASKSLRNVSTPAEIARGIGVLDQHLTNWKSRGLPKNSILEIAEWLGCNPYWLRDGTGKMSDINRSLTDTQYRVLELMNKMRKDDQERLAKIAGSLIDFAGE